MAIRIKDKELNIRDTLMCGQFFRYAELGDAYRIRSLDKVADIYYDNGFAVIDSDDEDYFYNFFDLDTDYQTVKARLYDKPMMKDAIDNAPGLRILRQDPFETIIDFIISANNHIPRIKAIIERLSEGGSFPGIRELAKRPMEFFSSLHAGYRDVYLYDTVQRINADPDIIDRIKNQDTLTASKTLCTLKGIGPKVADCILLFGYYRMDTFPVDTWIKKVYADLFGDIANPKIIRSRLLDTYGEFSGYAQQYLFYNKRG